MVAANHAAQLAATPATADRQKPAGRDAEEFVKWIQGSSLQVPQAIVESRTKVEQTARTLQVYSGTAMKTVVHGQCVEMIGDGQKKRHGRSRLGSHHMRNRSEIRSEREVGERQNTNRMT